MHTSTRLIDLFSPDHYALSLRLNRTQRTFSGTVTIEGAASSEHIRLHAKNLAISAVTLTGKAADFTLDGDELVVSRGTSTPSGEVVVVTFDGVITDAMHGLYPCYYEHDGEKKELLATQFESHHAREVFPCIDEPAAKATFDVTLTTEEDVVVLGNMPIAEQTNENGALVTAFETSPRMSTYLLAFITGDLHKKSAITTAGVEVNVWATPAQSPDSLDFALEVATRTIEFYDDYFGTAYPLPKSDHVALPDFGSGAMENWGLITYREVALLAGPNSSISSRQYIATVVAHELAHQWFGNLVTMKWWNNLWLNESFATLMEYIAVDALYPDWNIWLDFAAHESVMALRRDSIDGVQAVQIDVNHPDEISSLFDGAIVYAKGARLLRMLQQYVGDDDFQAGLKQYFKDFAYANTEGDDLWRAIENASGKPIIEMMNTWISQPGYPVVKLVANESSIELSQEQFFVGPHAKSSRTWPIPLNSMQQNAPTLLTESSAQFARSDDSLQLNHGDSAHFIAQYDTETFKNLLGTAADKSLPPIDRMQLLNQTTLLARGGRIASDQLLEAVRYYENETSEPVWGALSMALAELRKFVDDNEAAEKKLRALTARIARSQYERLGWHKIDGESEDDTKLRAIILSLTLYGESEEAIAEAKRIYHSTPLENLDPELRPLLISAAVRHGDDELVSELLQRYKTTSSAELREDICVGITSTRAPEKIALLLDAIKNPSIVRPQDAARWFVYLIRGRESRTATWQWLQANWQWIEDTFAGDKSYDDYPRYAATALLTPAELEEYKAFFAPLQSVVALKRVIAMGISEIEGRVKLIERDKLGVQQKLLETKA